MDKQTKTVSNPILRCISDGANLFFSACDGSETLADAGDVFKSGIDSDFKNWGLSKPIKPTIKTPAEVYELTKNADFKTMFTFLSTDWEKLCVTGHQVKIFCKENADWLRADGFGTFFLTKKNWKNPAIIGNLFVAGVRMDSYGLIVHVFRLEYDTLWFADDRPRLVVPQLVAQYFNLDPLTIILSGTLSEGFFIVKNQILLYYASIKSDYL